MKWGHESIQEFVDYTFWIEGISRSELAQHTRHRIASYNVMSHRHVSPDGVVMPDSFRNAHGVAYIDDDKALQWHVNDKGEFIWGIVGVDGDPVDHNIPLEDIRMFFPSAVKTNMFFKINGRSLRNFLKLRMNEHAQWEIREVARQIYEIVKQDCPVLVDKL